MRRALVCLALILVACAEKSSDPISVSHRALHRPQITEITLSPSSAGYMAGDGSIEVTADIDFWDSGRDVMSLSVTTPEGSQNFSGFPSVESGTFSVNFAVSTEYIGGAELAFWLVDGDGQTSISVSETFWVETGISSKEWTRRISGLSFQLNDVVWDGEVFVAVGDAGSVFTSADGIDWVHRETSVDANLAALATYESSIVAVGESGTVLLSQDHGVTWTVRHGEELLELYAVVIDASQIVVGGYRAGPDLFDVPITMVSADGGNTWEEESLLPITGFRFPADILFHAGLYVIAMEGRWFYPTGIPQVLVSTDARNWHAIDVGDEQRNAGLSAIVWDGSRFIVTGTGGGVFVSPDGYNWAQLTTPVRDAWYLGIAQNGEEVLFAGGAEPWGGLCGPIEAVPEALVSYDGLVTWEAVAIRHNYMSYGLARGPDRYVSVGSLSVHDDNCDWTIEGQIYTTE